MSQRPETRSLIAALLLALLAAPLAAACDTDCHDCGPHSPQDTTTLDASSDGDIDDGAAALCQCLLLVCHDEFHAAYGPTDEEAIPNCRASAGSLERSALECRQEACNQVSCEAALGGASCTAP